MNYECSNPEAAIAQELSPPGPVDAAIRVDKLSMKLGDGYTTSVFRFGCDGAELGLPVLYLHGIQSHPGWFCQSACHLAKLGHRVYLVTRRGSGSNTHGRGDTPSAEQLLADVNYACGFALADSQASRVHLVGVSWGGKLLAAYFSRYTLPEAASLTLVAPGLSPRVDVGAGDKLRILWARLVQPGRLFNIPLSDVELFTANPAMQAYLRSDRLSLRQATARLLVASRLIDREIAGARPGCIQTPTTLVLAGADRIIDNGESRTIVSRLTGGKARVVEMPGHHTLEFEPDPAGLLEVLAESMAGE